MKATYRYRLTRNTGSLFVTRETVVFVMLNPSTADDTLDDPTVRRCKDFASTWGFKNLTIVNLFAARATDPSALKKIDNAVGPMNDSEIVRQCLAADEVVLAWGAHEFAHARGIEVCEMLKAARPTIRLMCLGETKEGYPKHPLYIPASARPVPYGGPGSWLH